MPLIATVIRAARRTLDLLLILLILLVVGTVTLARVLPAATGGSTFIVGGHSMEPTVPLGSAVLAVPVASGDLQVGDIVSLKVGPRRAVFTHRIVRLVERPDGLYLETRGDANTAPDPSIVPASAVIGRVSLSIPFAGYALALMSSPQGVTFLLGLAVVLLAGAWLLETVEDDQREAARRATPNGTSTFASDPFGEPGPAV